MVKTDATIDCFCCGRQMGNWIYETQRSDGTSSRVTVHPMGGLHFITYGHYGSRVFDPMDGKGTTLDIAICDECIIENVKRVHGTGFSHVHEEALRENQQYRAEQDEKDSELLEILQKAVSEMERTSND
jgi:hypothetical protein